MLSEDTWVVLGGVQRCGRYPLHSPLHRAHVLLQAGREVFAHRSGTTKWSSAHFFLMWKPR